MGVKQNKWDVVCHVKFRATCQYSVTLWKQNSFKSYLLLFINLQKGTNIWNIWKKQLKKKSMKE